ncbi:hypothetical protein MVEG_10797 [Podila verticillata NRRL 6337]|nr:hypothetical protein MVEG_10797 [Podila verticillata NRRL 6337]
MATTPSRPPKTTSRPPIVPKPPTTSKPPIPTIAPPVIPTSTIKPIVTTTALTTTTTTTTTISNLPSRIITFNSNPPVSRPPKTTTSSSVIARDDSGGMSPGIVAGMSAGVLAVLIVSVVGAFLLLKQRKKRMMFMGSSRDYKGYPEPDLSRLPVQRYKPDTDDETTPKGDDDNVYRNSTHSNGKRRIDVTSSYYDDEYNRTNQTGYSESWTGFVANGRRQGSESGQRTPNSMGLLVESASSLPMAMSQEELHEKGHELAHQGSDDHLNGVHNLAHVMPMSSMPARTPSMRGSGYGYDHVSPVGSMSNLHRGSGYYQPSPQLRPHHGGPPSHDLQGFQRPVSVAYGPGPGAPSGPYMRPPQFMNHPYQQDPRAPYGHGHPGGQRPYSVFSTSGNLMQPMPLQYYSVSDLNTPTSPVSSSSPSSPISPITPLSPTSTLLSNHQLYASEDASTAAPVTNVELTSGSISTASGSQTRVSSPVFLPGDNSRLSAQRLSTVVANVDDKLEAKVEEVAVIPLQNEKDDVDVEVLLEPVDDVNNNETEIVAASSPKPPPIIKATRPTSMVIA